MILCPNCLHKEMVGAVFCSECGAQLVFSEGVPTGAIRSPSKGLPSEDRLEKIKEKGAPPPANILEAKVSLNIVNSGEILPLKSQKEITLGRVSGGQPIIPDIDLTPYKAYEGGVSRMHASIRISEDEVSITDLGSANGTRINGRKITSHISYPIKHGDILTLGKFKIQVLLRNN
jgi:pSer/pThr/pTyr-binding forkhead associated (FHA) protein